MIHRETLIVLRNAIDQLLEEMEKPKVRTPKKRPTKNDKLFEMFEKNYNTYRKKPKP